jgi:type IV pilus assembly protein PilP
MRLRPAHGLLPIICSAIIAGSLARGDEPIPTPSEKMKEAVGKLNKAPASIGQSLQGLRDAAVGKLKETLGSGAKAGSKAAPPVDLNLPQKSTETPAAPHVLKDGSRDPFRPMTLRTRVSKRPRENLSPLERFDLGQLKVVGIVWNISEPQAMVEDTAGLGYVVRKGTAIGSNEGKVKTIQRDRIIVEENYEDAYGMQKKRDVSMRLSTE